MTRIDPVEPPYEPEVGKQVSLTMRDREIVIDRTCARCRCEYEWGVHTNGARVALEDGAPRFADYS